MTRVLTAPLASGGEHLVAVIAHPDDESFGCGSLIAQAVGAGARVTIVCATRGEAGERRPDPTTDAWPIGLLRESELCQAAVVLGVTDVQFLDLVDSGMTGEPPAGALIALPVVAVADLLAARLVPLRPDVVLALDGSDGHRDHAHLRDALTIAAARLDPPPRLVHSCLARSLMADWARELGLREPHRAHLGGGDALGRPDAELVSIDTRAVLPIRERAIACHLSQASPFERLSPGLRRRFLTTDHVVEVELLGAEPAPGASPGGRARPVPDPTPTPTPTATHAMTGDQP